LYDDTYVRYERRPAPPKAIVPLHVLHDPLTPMHSNNPLTLELPPLTASLANKALIVRVDPDGRTHAVGGNVADGGITANIRAFGAYSVMIDTVAPTIAPLDLKSEMLGRRAFRMKVSDDLSGLAKYTGTLDGKWVLLEYEPKTNTLTHTFDRYSTGSGTRTFTLEVTDERGNSARFSRTFTQ
nr:hypothetical protein [Flavobacteriales bacterium]